MDSFAINGGLVGMPLIPGSCFKKELYSLL